MTLHTVTSAGNSYMSGMQPQVLVVEDEPMVAEITCRMVEQAGFGCEWVDRGKRALELIEMTVLQVDLAIIDVHLPDILGTDVARAIRDRRPGTPIIFTSAYPTCQADPPELEAAVFVPKPYSWDELGSAMRQLLPAIPASACPAHPRSDPPAAPSFLPR